VVEELLRVGEDKKAVHSPYMAYSVVTDSSVYAHSLRVTRLKNLKIAEETQQEGGNIEPQGRNVEIPLQSRLP